MTDARFYEEASAEFTSSRNSATWTKALAECDGNEERAKFMYVRLRAAELDPGTHTAASPSNKSQTPAVQFTKAQRVFLSGALAKEMEDEFSRRLGVSKYSKVLCDVYVSPQVLVVSPSAKDRKSLALAGLLLGGGSGLLGALGLAIGTEFTKRIQDGQSDKSAAAVGALTGVAVFETGTCEVQAREVVADWIFTGRIWETWIKVTGPCTFNGQRSINSLRLGYEGRATESQLLTKRVEQVELLCTLMNKPIPRISVAKTVDF